MAMRQQQQQASEAIDRTGAPANADRVADWLNELELVVAKAASLPAAARQALVATINAFEAEDGPLPASALWARKLLLGTANSGAPRSDLAPARLQQAPYAAITTAGAATPRTLNEPPLRVRFAASAGTPASASVVAGELGRANTSST
jgi:hypothetical protein